MLIAICDDEEFFRKDIENKIREYAVKKHIEIDVVNFTDGSELLASDKVFDIIFIDFQMEGSNGIDTVRELRKRNSETKVIFESSFPEIVFETMKFKTFRFLVKPVTDDAFCEALDAALKERKDDFQIIVKDMEMDMNITIPEKDIIYVQADNIYSIIVTADLTYKYMNNISALQKELRSLCFYRTNRSFLVNMNYIQSYNNKEITLENGHKAVISKLKYKEFKNTYLDYIKTKSMR